MPTRPKLGQHFLHSESVVRRIVESVPPGGAVVEIGPGHGALTAGLLEVSRRYLGVELDRWLHDRLARRYADREGFSLVNADFLDFSPPPELGDGITLAGNVPYAISARIVQRACAEPRYGVAVLMFQREFADRLLAGPGEPGYGSLSVYVDHHFTVRRLLNVPRSKFRPAPRVDSAVVLFQRRPDPPVEVDDPEAYFALVRACFARRRKQLANAACGDLGLDRDTWREALEAAGIDRRARAETLTPQQFAQLYGKLEHERG